MGNQNRIKEYGKHDEEMAFWQPCLGIVIFSAGIGRGIYLIRRMNKRLTN
jgi:hypothetical protein